MGLIGLCAAALVGIAVGDLIRLESARLVFGGGVAALGAALAWRRPAWRLLALITLAAAVGALRASVVPAADTTALDAYLGLPVRLRGVVVQPPSDASAAVQLTLEVVAIAPAGRDALPVAAASESSAGLPTGAVSVRVVGEASTFAAVASGETLVLEARLVASDRPGAPTLLFPRLLERHPAPPMQLTSLLDRVRTSARAGIERSLPEPQASVAAGVLLGGAGRLDADMRLQLQRSGLAHLLAIDGFKQVVVAGVLAGVTVPLIGPRPAALPVLLGVSGYTLLTGAHPAAVRAGLMVGLSTLASLSGRVSDPLTSVLVAATLMAAFEPRVVFDVGWQLSVSATLGIVLVWPRLRSRLAGVPGWIAEPVGLTLAVTLATLPVTLSSFHLVSLVSPVAHVVAVPLLPAVLLSAALLALASPFPPLAAPLAWVAWLPSSLLIGILELFGSLPGAALATGRLEPWAAGGLAACLLVWGLWGLPEASALRDRLRSAAAWKSAGEPSERGKLAGVAQLGAPAACMAACAGAAVLLQVMRPDGRLHVQHLPQSRGEAVFIRGPTGRTLLVVGGRLDGSRLASQVAGCLALWEHQLDAVLELDSDAQAGLGPALAAYAAAQRLDATSDTRLDLGGGALVDVYASAAPTGPGVSISFGGVWLPLVGRPPPSYSIDAARILPRPYDSAADLVSDGRDVWRADSAARLDARLL